jgi:hypothetical protein
MSADSLGLSVLYQDFSGVTILAVSVHEMFNLAMIQSK